MVYRLQIGVTGRRAGWCTVYSRSHRSMFQASAQNTAPRITHRKVQNMKNTPQKGKEAKGNFNTLYTDRSRVNFYSLFPPCSLPHFLGTKSVTAVSESSLPTSTAYNEQFLLLHIFTHCVFSGTQYTHDFLHFS